MYKISQSIYSTSIPRIIMSKMRQIFLIPKWAWCRQKHSIRVFILYIATYKPTTYLPTIEEGWRTKQRQRSSRLLGGQKSFNSLPCYSSCFVSVDMQEKVEFILFFQIDRGKTASAARNWMNFPLLLSPSFFYASYLPTIRPIKQKRFWHCSSVGISDECSIPVVWHADPHM